MAPCPKVRGSHIKCKPTDCHTGAVARIDLVATRDACWVSICTGSDYCSVCPCSFCPGYCDATRSTLCDSEVGRRRGIARCRKALFRAIALAVVICGVSSPEYLGAKRQVTYLVVEYSCRETSSLIPTGSVISSFNSPLKSSHSNGPTTHVSHVAVQCGLRASDARSIARSNVRCHRRVGRVGRDCHVTTYCRDWDGQQS